ncbi:MAG TPA: D-aminoacyl-tRNA deacylase [Pseudomonadales bacterium]|nr:D-aminoacyl-tRNA deacylase [Pseudomonadales bacterium]
MKLLLQRVKRASVEVDQQIVGKIEQGILVFIAVERGDSAQQADFLLNKLLNYRLFADADGKMNLNVQQVNGGLLLVSQFTLAADTAKGLRPSFTPAASPEEGRKLFDYFVERARATYDTVATGQFGADMQVALVNDGPVTFWLEAKPVAK